jgi:hypothetical protein
MVRRKKRLEKGKSSIHEVAVVHEERIKNAIERNDEELVGYLRKDLKRLKTEEAKKEVQLKKIRKKKR